jgi:hypothetical protein
MMKVERFGLALFQKRFAGGRGPPQPSRHCIAHMVAVKIWRVQQRGCGVIGPIPLRVATGSR